MKNLLLDLRNEHNSDISYVRIPFKDGLSHVIISEELNKKKNYVVVADVVNDLQVLLYCCATLNKLNVNYKVQIPNSINCTQVISLVGLNRILYDGF